MTIRKIFEQLSCACKSTCGVLVVCATIAITTQAQVFIDLLNFNGNSGSNPEYESLVQGPDGNFYGTTSAGGAYNGGTVFRITPAGKLKLYSFCAQPSCADGGYPVAGLALAIDGNFYGTTSGGGANGNYGTVFKITPRGTLTTLYSFCAQPNCTDGSGSTAALVQGTDNNFYGTTNTGGTNNRGTVFKITAGGTLTTLYSFCAQPSCTDGSDPWAGLIQATDGNFYGTTVNGGTYDEGTVFRITPSGKLRTLYSFDWDGDFHYEDGAGPFAGLIQASDGNLYGTTVFGGVFNCASGCGTIFKMTQAGEVTTLYRFTDSSPDVAPHGGLIQGTDGNLYGTIRGADYWGALFKITLQGTLTGLHSFSLSDGAHPQGQLLQATNGIFYGTTSEGGDYRKCNPYYGCGTVYSLSMGLGPFVSFVRNSARVGYRFGILGQGFTGTTDVSLNGTPANFTVKSDTLLTATVPDGATTGYVTVTIPSGILTSNVPFHVIP